ncbi:MAG: MFS transporter [Candidatus Freyarchaeota archaeon]|nr:MFS transporter [Candidatus Jordarchaeia archaeon]
MKWYRAYFPFRVASAATIPLIPLYVNRLGGGLAEAGLAVAMFNLTAAFASLFFGRLSKPRVLRSYALGGFLGLTLASAVFYSAPSVVYVFMASAIAGFATAICALAAVLLIAETNEGSSWNREIGRFNRVSDFGWLTGLVVGALWSYFSMEKEVFIISATLAGMSFAYTFTVLKHHPSGGIHAERVEVDLDGEAHATSLAALYVASTFLMFMSTSLGYSLLPSFIVGMDGTSTEVFLAYVTSTTISVLTYPRVEGLSRGDNIHVQSWASAGRVLIMVAFALSSLLVRGKGGIVLVMAAMSLSGFTWAILNVAGPAAAMKLAHEKKGKIMGVYNATIFLSSIAGSALSGIIAESLGYPTLFLTAALLTLASIPLLERARLMLKRSTRTVTATTTQKCATTTSS